MKFLVLATLLLSTSVARAEEDTWTFGPSALPRETASQQEKPLPNGSILKWCEENGKRVRYSQNLVPGYRLCGEVEANKLCDPSGRRFISRTGGPLPSIAYKDCSLGERIKVVRNDPLIETPFPGDEPSLKPPPHEAMTRAEKAEAKKELERIRKDQEGQLAREVQAIMDELNKAFGALNADRRRR